MKGTPKQPNPNAEGTVIQTKVNFDPDIMDKPEEAVAKRSRVDIRRMRITPAFLAKYCYTGGAKGADSNVHASLIPGLTPSCADSASVKPWGRTKRARRRRRRRTK